MNAPPGEFSERFQESVGRPFLCSTRLSLVSNFKIGGPADYYFCAASLKELEDAVLCAQREKVRYYIIGGGYNVLFDDKGYRGLIIKNEAKSLRMSEDDTVKAASGTGLDDFLEFCVKHGIEGYEFLAGIPGSIGGAVFGNAGAFGESIGDFLEQAVLLSGNQGQIEVTGESLGFGYRHSRLKIRHDLLINARFSVKYGDRAVIKERIRKNLEWRRNRHPWETACAGSYFKNPCPPGGEVKAAAFYLDQVGAKGFRIGGAEVSEAHANFILNAGEATAEDVLAVAREMKRRVRDTFGIELEEEVIYLSQDAAIS
jgi:UDP-N-acetylmuramate dehydrogenase